MRRLLLLAALFVAGCGEGSSPADDVDLSEPEAMMLRLSDLPQGFRYGDDRGCAQVAATERGPARVDRLLLDARPRVCLGDFAREWGGPPRIVQSALFLFEDPDDAREAWSLRADLFESFGRIRIANERGAGDAIAFDSRGLQQPGAGEAWRDDRLVVVVYEEGLGGERGREFARGIADNQRARIESPSDPAPEDDREIGLEDPAIAIPVYWLGREFSPDGLPKLTLYRGDHLRGAGPGNDVKIDYGGERTGVTLDLWRPDAWRRFERTRLGKLARCDGAESVRLAGARAEICRAAAGHWLANVFYEDVVVAVQMPYCYTCGGRPADDPYNSPDGMEAVVRGLRRR